MNYAISQLELKAAAQKLPPAPQIFGRLGRLLRDRNSGLDDILKLVSKDPSLVAQVLRISNSAIYSTGEPIDDLNEAVNRIGFSELYKIVGVAASTSTFPSRNETYGVTGSAMWENALAVAMVMEKLAARAKVSAQEAYAIGMLRSIGKQIIDSCAANHSDYPSYSPETDGPIAEWEEANFGLTSPRVASLIMRAWKLPKISYQAVEYQYSPDIIPTPNPFARLLNIAGGIADDIGKSIPGEASYWELNEEHYEEVGLESDDIEQTHEYVSEKMSDVVGALAA